MTDESKWLKSRLYDMACASPKPECSVPYKAMKLIEELEAPIDGQAYLAGKEYGRLQGLDEATQAAAKEAERYASHYPEGTDGRNTFTILADSLRGHILEALKEQSND